MKYPAGNLRSLSSYKDADTVPAYARPSTAAAAQANIVVSYPAPNQLSPNISASRAEVAAFVYQALVKAGRVSPIAAKPESRWQITPITTIAAKTYRLSLSENGQRLAAIVNDRLTGEGPTIQVWNTQTGSLLKTLTVEAPDSSFIAIALSKDGTQIAFTQTTASTGAMQLTVQTVEDGKVLLTRDLLPPENQRPTGEDESIVFDRLDVVFSPDDKQVMTEVKLRTISGPKGFELVSPVNYHYLDFQNIATKEVTQSIEMRQVSGYTKPVLSPDGNLLAIPSEFDADSRGNIKIFRRNNNSRFDFLRVISVDRYVYGNVDMIFTSSNLLNLTTFRSSAVLDTWNLQTGEQVQSTELPTERCIELQGFTPSPDGTSYFRAFPPKEFAWAISTPESFKEIWIDFRLV